MLSEKAILKFIYHVTLYSRELSPQQSLFPIRIHNNFAQYFMLALFKTYFLQRDVTAGNFILIFSSELLLIARFYT